MRWLIILLISLTFACSKKQEQPPAAPEPAEEAGDSTEVEAPPEAKAIMEDPGTATEFRLEDLPPLPPALGGETPELGSAPAVVVLENGSAPRKALRWSVERGLEQKVKARLGLSIDTVVVLLKANMPMTVQEYDLSLKVARLEDDGTAQVAFAVEGSRPVLPPGAESELSAQEKAALAEKHAVKGSYTLEPNGALTDFRAVRASDGSPADPGVVDALRWSLLQMTPVLPTEPIGVGAKWTVHEPLMQGGIHAQQLRTFELVSLEGNRVDLSVDVRQTGSPQPYTSPLTGAKFELQTLNGVAKGAVSWSLDRVGPLTADISADSLDGAIFRNPEKTRKAGLAVHSKRTIEVAAP